VPLLSAILLQANQSCIHQLDAIAARPKSTLLHRKMASQMAIEKLCLHALRAVNIQVCSL